ncbi:hypothetical protein HYV98_00240 [Candidatus Azambacteria bacterium]|nr:hypothetical protein [Candidatus Azambacteria bacterium]
MWFSKNERQILEAVKTKSWWRERVLVLEPDLVFAPGKLILKLTDFGYETVREITGPGEFSQRGGIIDIAPINSKDILRIEFRGNRIERIVSIRLKERRDISLPRGAERKTFRIGDYVVHLDHGIGIFRGDEEKRGRRYFVVEYAPPPRPHAPPDRLLVPEEQRKKLSPYYGFTTPAIHRLGGALWPKTKRKAKESALQIARELLSGCAL